MYLGNIHITSGYTLKNWQPQVTISNGILDYLSGKGNMNYCRKIEDLCNFKCAQQQNTRKSDFSAKPILNG